MPTFGYQPAPAVAGPMAFDAQAGVLLKNRSNVNLWPDPHALAPAYMQGTYLTYGAENPVTQGGRCWIVNGQTTAGHSVTSAILDARGFGALITGNATLSYWYKGLNDFIWNGVNYGPPAGAIYVGALDANQNLIHEGAFVFPNTRPQIYTWQKYQYSFSPSYIGLSSWSQLQYLRLRLYCGDGDVAFAEIQLIASVNAQDTVIFRALPGGGVVTDDTLANKTRDIIALQRALLA